MTCNCCLVCCCKQIPETEDSEIEFGLTAEECTDQGGEVVPCPSPCDCNCDYNDGLAISGTGTYPFYYLPIVYGNSVPFTSIPYPSYPTFCDVTIGPYTSEYRYSTGGPGPSTYYEAKVDIYITLNCCTQTLTIAAGVRLYDISPPAAGVFLGTVAATITLQFQGYPCPTGTPTKTIEEEWVPEAGAPTSPCTTLAAISGAGMYLDDILDPLASLTCPPLAC